MAELGRQGLISKKQFDEAIEWEWYFLWHHEGRRARHGAAMMAPDYTHWHGMYEVADRFYQKLDPGGARDHARRGGAGQEGPGRRGRCADRLDPGAPRARLVAAGGRAPAGGAEVRPPAPDRGRQPDFCSVPT